MKILLYLLLSSSLLFASIGKITSAKGEVFVERNSKQALAKAGYILEENDKVITKNKSRALLLFTDKTSITMGKNSSLQVNDYVFDPKVKVKNKAKFKFAKGLFRTITGKIGKLNPNKFKLKVRSATIGIRGSDGTSRVLANGDVTHTTNDGGFTLTNDKTGQTVVIPKGSTGVFNVKGLKVAPSTQADLDDGNEVEDSEEEKKEKEKEKAKEDKEKKDKEDKEKKDKEDKEKKDKEDKEKKDKEEKEKKDKDDKEKKEKDDKEKKDKD